MSAGGVVMKKGKEPLRSWQNPIHQFQIVNYFSLGKIGSVNLAFTNSALYMGVAVGIIAAFDARRPPLDASSYPDECSQWPSSPTSSSPTPYATR